MTSPRKGCRAVIGVDFGTLSGRAVVVSVGDGSTLGASAAMGHKQTAAYPPDEDRAAAYDPLYAEYATLHDYFGRGINDVMHPLRAPQRKAGRN